MNPSKGEFLAVIEEMAPGAYAEAFDNVGLLIDTGLEQIRKVLLALDLTVDVAQEAIDGGVDLVVTHHPIFFSPVHRLSVNDPTQKAAIMLLRHGISHLAAHTNFDSAPEGINVQMCERLGLRNHWALEPKSQNVYKVVTFVPASHREVVREALAGAGAGRQGAYSHCSFSSFGEGRFQPLEGAKPFLGKIGATEMVEEVRVECLVLENDRSKVVAALQEAHPYEEPAYDIFLQTNPAFDAMSGLSRAGHLVKSMTLREFAGRVKEVFGSAAVLFSGDPDQAVECIAVSSGAGAGSWQLAREAGADVLVTGEAKYNQVIDALTQGIPIVQAGHYETERLGMHGLLKGLQLRADQLQWKCEIVLSERETAPIQGI